MRRIKTTAALAMLMVALTATAALAATLHGTNRGNALYGTSRADTIYAYGGADLVYGYGGEDTLQGGNEAGWGDKLLGGDSDDRVIGQGGDDALYGDGGNDGVYGGSGGDLVQGGYGHDVLDGGPGADRINAREGQKDTIVIRPADHDTVYYDRGIDVLRVRMSLRGSVRESTSPTPAETGKVEFSTRRPPQGLFGHTGKVLVKHEGKELLVAEKDLKGHLGHGDEILDPTGRAEANQGRR